MFYAAVEFFGSSQNILAVDYKSGPRENGFFLVMQLIHSFLGMMFSNMEHKQEKIRTWIKK